MIDTTGWRQAPAESLGLQLMALRNLSLSRLDLARAPAGAFWAGHAAWWQEYWIARHLQRGRGAAADRGGVRLASILPQADAWFGADAAPLFAHQGLPSWACASTAAELPFDDGLLRGYLAESFDTVQELLAAAAPSHAGLHFFRTALWHEGRCSEALAEACAAAQQPLPGALAAGPPARPVRMRLFVPAQRCVLGESTQVAGNDGLASSDEGPQAWSPPAEQGRLIIDVPEFEIDAQPVNWAEFSEFAQDGGYDDARWWTSAGWAWLQATGQRAPHGVEQLLGAVVAQRFGRSQRLPGQAPVMHVSFHEAQAWCAWAGRRLPTEAEWQLGAEQGSGRGFVWGDVWEWTLSPARPYEAAAAGTLGSPGSPSPALHPGPGFAAWPDPAPHGVLRACSWLTPAVLREPGARRFWPLDATQAFVGFRSCSA